MLCPTIRIAQARHDDGLRHSIRHLSEYDWLVFTSANGVRQFWDLLEEEGAGTEGLVELRVAAIGPGTAAELERHGVRPDLVPDRYVAESVAEALIARGIRGRRILLPRAAGAREVLPERLRGAGARVDHRVAYVSEPDRDGIARLREEIAGGRLDMVTFTAASTVRFFVERAGAEAGRARVATIGPITAEAVRRAGLDVDVVASEYTIPGLVEAICDFYRKGEQGS